MKFPEWTMFAALIVATGTAVANGDGLLDKAEFAALEAMQA